MIVKHPDTGEENAIGYWYANDSRCEALPKPQDFVDKNWNKEALEVVANYLDRGRVIHRWRGSSNCRLCIKWSNGSTCLTDGKYIWPEGFSHYLREHNVKPPLEFLTWVALKINEK